MDQQPTPAPILPTEVVNPGMPERDADVRENKDMAAISYVWVLSVFVYLFRRASPFVRFHAKQGMVLFSLSVICWFIPIIGRLLVLGILALAVLGFIAAAQGQWKQIPVIYHISLGDSSGVRHAFQAVIHRIGKMFHRTKKAASQAEPQRAESSATNPPPTPAP